MNKFRFPTMAQYLLFITNVIITIVELLIGLRIVLKLLGANPASPFVAWLYQTSAPLVGPFAGIFPTPTINGFFVIEFSAIFAFVVYALIAYIIETIIRYLDTERDRTRR